MSKSFSLAAALTLLATLQVPAPADPVALGAPLESSHFREKAAYQGLSQMQLAALEEPVQKWQANALSALSREDSAEEDYQLLSQGVAFRLERDLPTEFLAEVSDERMRKLYKHAEKARPSFEAVNVNRRVSQEILSRKGLEAEHDRAAYLLASMELVLARSSDDAVRGFHEARQLAATASGRTKLDRAVAALTNPVEPADYAEVVELMEVCRIYPGRLQGGFVIAATSKQYKDQGAEHFSPRKFGGNPQPLVTATRIAFDGGDHAALGELQEIAEAELKGDRPALAQVRYWVGMEHYAGGDFEKAIKHFSSNTETEPGNEWEAWSFYRLAECHMGNRDYLETGIWLLETLASCRSYPAVVAYSEKLLNFIVTNEYVAEATVYTAFADRQNLQETADLNTSSHNVSIKETN